MIGPVEPREDVLVGEGKGHGDRELRCGVFRPNAIEGGDLSRISFDYTRHAGLACGNCDLFLAGAGTQLTRVGLTSAR